jgi:tetratricopeptide (TPR) repeat protein
MFINILLILIILVSFGIILKIVFSKFSRLSLIEIENLPREQQGKVKKEIIKNRLEKKLEKIYKKILYFLKFLEPFGLKLKEFFCKYREKFLILEQKYIFKYRHLIKKEPELIQNKIKKLFIQGKELIEKKNFIEAEKKFIEIISFDSKNIEAYKQLVEIYFQQNDFEHTKEILYFIQKINPNDETISTQLGVINKSLGQHKEAINNFKKALFLTPNNPKNLDLLIEEYIIVKNQLLAEKVLKKLEEVNPENQKIKEFKDRIKKM